VVGAAHHHAANAFLEGRAVHVVGEGDVLVLGPELGVAVLLPGGGVEIGRAHEAAVDDSVGALEVLPVGMAIRIGEVGDDEARHRLPSRVVGRTSMRTRSHRSDSSGIMRWAT
jgi:hypothetical protein